MAAALLLGAAPLQAASGDEPMTLRVTGDAGAAFSAECTLTSADGKRTISVAQPVPYEVELVGSGLRCRIETSGAIEVEIVKGGNVSRTRSAGGRIQVSVGP
jgi:hypothetical protein